MKNHLIYYEQLKIFYFKKEFQKLIIDLKFRMKNFKVKSSKNSDNFSNEKKVKVYSDIKIKY